jgi:hypothetical protein
VRFQTGTAYEVESRSLALFAALTPGEPGRAVQAIALELEESLANFVESFEERPEQAPHPASK